MRWSSAVVLALASLLPNALAVGILAIDYGTEWTKLSLVKPGTPFDVLLNRDSKRKIQSVVSIRGEDRLFGGDAAATAARFPQNSYAGAKLLLGESASSPSASQHSSLFSIPLSATSRSSVSLRPTLPPPSNASYLPEDLVAMQFQYFRELAESQASEKVVDAIVTVPTWFTQPQRNAILDAMSLAGLRNLGLVEDGATVGVNYAMTRAFSKEPEHHVIYDAGAGGIRATVVAFTMEEQKINPKSKILKNVTTVEVKGTGWDRTVGGWAFDGKIRDMLRTDFEAKSGVKLDGNGRALAKLLREAARVKQVLSANQESQSRIEGLAEDVDFKSSVSRQQFEDAFAADAPKFTQPIVDALDKAGLTLADIRSVILVGGTSRVPMVQSAVKSLVGEDKVAVNVNADEAAVMGAALYGAGLSRQFKTKDVRLGGVAPYAIEADHEVDAKGSEPARQVKTSLFPTNARAGVKKTLNLKKLADFTVLFRYPSPPTSAPGEILEASVQGLASALSNHTNSTGIVFTTSQNVTVKLSVQLSESGILSVPSASVVLPTGKVDEGGLGGRIAGLFGGKKGKVPGEGGEEAGSGENKEEPADGSFEAQEAKLKADLEGKKNKDGNETSTPSEVVVPLTVVVKHLGIQPMSTADKVESGKLLRELKSAETRKRVREEARNSLEAYTYKIRDLLDSAEFTKAATKAEVNAIKGLREQVVEWLGDWAETATAKELKQKKGDLEKMEQPISTRLLEERKRPDLYLAAESAFDRAKQWAVSMAASRPTTTSSASDDDAPPARFSEEEISAFDKLHSETRSWFTDQRKLQDGKKLWEDPVLRSREVEGKLKFLESEVARLERRKPPRRRPKPTASASKDPLAEAMEALNLTMADINNLTAGSDEPTTTGDEPTETTTPKTEPTQAELKHEEL